MATINNYEPGSVEQNEWLATMQTEDIVPYGTSVEGEIAGADLQTNDYDQYRSMKFVVLYAVPLHVMKSLVYQSVISQDVYNRTPLFKIMYPRGTPENQNKYSAQTCKMDPRSAACTQSYVTLYKHAFEYLQGTEGKKGTFPMDYDGSHYVVFVPFKFNRPIMCSKAINHVELMGGKPNKKGRKREKLLGLDYKAQDVIVLLLLFLLLVAIIQNQRLQEKLNKRK